MSYFITGTDTDVGKTLIACALLHGFAAQGKRVVGMKPVAAGGSLLSNGAPAGVLLAGAAGCADAELHEDVRQLRAASNVLASLGQINPYYFVPAVAPHLAAQFAGVIINLERIGNSFAELAGQADVVIVEGAGGFVVPLNDHEDSADLVMQLGLPIILVVGMRLGCLNHALLTVEAIIARGLTLAGWVANCVEAEMMMLNENIAALQQRIGAPRLGIVPYQVQLDAREVVTYLNFKLLDSVSAND